MLYRKSSSEEAALLEVKEILDYLFEYVLKMKLSLELSTPQNDYAHPKNFYKIYAENEGVGELFEINPRVSDKIEEGCVVVGLEINFSKLCSQPQIKTVFEKISKYPTTKLDFNFLIPQGKLYKDIISIAQSIDTDLNYKVNLLDIYENANGQKSYTLHYEVNSLERTLTTEDIDRFHAAVISKFEQNGIGLKL